MKLPECSGWSKALLAVLLCMSWLPASNVHAQAPMAQAAGTQQRTVWYFYKMRWGHQDEFVNLFKKNHYPVLKAQIPSRIASVLTFVPTYHGDGRSDWTFAVAITFKDMAAMTGPSNEAEIVKKLYPIRRRSGRKSSGASRSSTRTGMSRSTRST